MLQAELADSFSWLGSTKEALGELNAAERLYAQEMEIVRRLRQAAPGDSLWTNREVRALQHRAANRLALGMDEQALGDYRQARLLSVAMVEQDKLNLAWQGELANVELEEQSILARARRDGQVGPRIAQIHARLAALVKSDPKNAIWARREAVARMRLASVLLRDGHVDGAREQAREALRQVEALYGRDPGNRNLRLAKIDALALSARASEAAKDFAAQRSACVQAYELLKDDAPSSHDFRILVPWARVSQCTGNDAAAAAAAGRLRDLGYRDTEFTQFYSPKSRKEK
jgi:hypothetical protein